MRLAFSSRSKRGDSWEDVSNYCDVTLFNREGLAQYLTKGTRIGVAGRLSYREWEGENGKRSVLEVVANDVQLLDGKRDGAPAKAQDTDIPF